MNHDFLTYAYFLVFFFVFPFFHAASIRSLVFKDQVSSSWTLAVSLLTTTILNGICLALCYSIFSKHDDSFYLSVLAAVNGAIAIYSLRYMRNYFSTLCREIASKPCATALFVSGLAILYTTTMQLIPQGNDILEYFEIARVFYREKHLFYPVLPFYAENLFDSHGYHPPFFTVILSLGYIIQRTAENYHINSLILGFYTTTLFTMIFLSFRKFKQWWLLFILVVVFMCPLFMRIAFIPRGLDSFRISYFLLAFVLMREYFKQGTYRTLVIMSLGVGAGLSAHSSGFMFFVFFMAIFSCMSSASTLQRKYANIALVALIALSIGAWQYVANYIHMGKILSDDTPIWSLFNYNEFMRYERNLYSRKLLFEAFLGLFTEKNYGYLYTLWVILLISGFKQTRFLFVEGFKSLFKAKSTVQEISFAEHTYFAFLFLFAVFIALCMNQELIIKNYRYMMTPFPFAMVSSFGFLAVLSEQPNWLNRLRTFALKIKNVQLKTLSFAVCAFTIIGFYSFMQFNLERISYLDNKLTLNEFFSRDEEPYMDKLQYRNKDLIEYLRSNWKKDDVIFAFDRNYLHLFLRDAKVLFYMNDTLEETYKLKTPAELYENLKSKNVKYIFNTQYQPSILNQSAFGALLSDPKFTTLEVNHGALYLYRLNDSIQTKTPSVTLVEERSTFLRKGSSKTVKFKNLPANAEFEIKYKLESEPNFFDINTAVTVHCQDWKRTLPILDFTYNGDTSYRFSTKEDPIDECTYQLRNVISSKNKAVRLLIQLNRL